MTGLSWLVIVLAGLGVIAVLLFVWACCRIRGQADYWSDELWKRE